MILSHRHRFIFLKTKKTGGTSVELALSQICGEADVITQVIPRDEILRRGRGPQNQVVPEALRPWTAHLRHLLGQSDRAAGLIYYNHMTAAEVKRTVDSAVWRSYKKVSIERNPWDREVSNYFWKWKKEPRPSFSEYVLNNNRATLNNFEIYSVRGRLVADVMLGYERLDVDFRMFIHSLGVENIPELPQAKGSFRPDWARDYRSLYTPETRAAVARLYRREIEAFGYSF